MLGVSGEPTRGDQAKDVSAILWNAGGLTVQFTSRNGAGRRMLALHGPPLRSLLAERVFGYPFGDDIDTAVTRPTDPLNTVEPDPFEQFRTESLELVWT
jgi:hypothetical protein